MPHPDDLAALKAERDAADRAYNEALTRLDRAIQKLPHDFPHAPPGPDEHQLTPLNVLWKIETSPTGGRPSHYIGERLAAIVRRVVAPLFEHQQRFNAAVVDHLNRNVPVARETRASIASTLTVLHDAIAELVRFHGPFASPTVGVDAMASAATVARIGAAVGTGGLSAIGEVLLGSAVAATDTGGGACAVALGKAAPASASSTPAKTPAAANPAQDLGSAVGKLFGR